MYDTAIIGSGPAGLSAALNLKLHNKDFIWFGSGELSAKVEKSEKIANYPGLGMIAGPELNRHFTEQTEEMGILPTDKMVTTIMADESGYQLLAGNDIYEAKTLLLAIGAAAAKGFPGEERLLGRGVSYCATCDGFLYRGKTIAVYCGDPRFGHEVAYLSELAAKVYLYTPYSMSEAGRQNTQGIVSGDDLRKTPNSFNEADRQNTQDIVSAVNLPNVELLQKPIRQVTGENRVTGIVLTDQTEISVDGLFCLRNAVAPATLLPGLVVDGAHIVVNRSMETNLPGCYAAGDCTGRPYQIAKAVGEGNVAAHSILDYLSQELAG